MKLFSALICSFFLICGITHASNKLVIITGKVYPDSTTEVHCFYPFNGVLNNVVKKSVSTDANGNFRLEIPCEQTCQIFISSANGGGAKLVMSPGESFNLQLGSANAPKAFELKGPNKEGQDLFAALPRNPMIEIAARRYVKDTLVSTIEAKINAAQAKDLAPFEALLKAKKISPAFYEYIVAEGNSYYATMRAAVIWIKISRFDQDKLAQFPPAFKSWSKEIFQNYPPQNLSYAHTNWWFQYVQTYLKVTTYLSEDFDVQDIITNEQAETYHTYTLDIAQKYLKGIYLELFYAQYLVQACEPQKYEKELIGLFQQFKKTYQKSAYTASLEPVLAPTIEYHRVKELSSSASYQFVDNYSNLNSLEAALTSLKGKKLYIDVWATWCSPCKAEFAHKEKLKALLNAYGYEILYVSIDEAKRDEAWKNMIKFFKLEGYHLRTNVEMEKDMRRIFDQNDKILIPWYLIVNQEGQIVVKDAERPSDLKALEEQLKRL